MRYAALLCLLIAAPATARGSNWEWKCLPVTDCDRAEIRRVATLTPLSRCALEAEAERERHDFNRQSLMRYNGMLPAPRIGTMGMGGIR